MAVNRVVHQNPQAFQFGDSFTRIEKETGNSIIISDLLTNVVGPTGDLIVNKRSLWLKVVNGTIYLLNDAPDTLPETTDEQDNWAMSRLIIKGADVYYVEYNDASKDSDHRSALTSYEPSVAVSDEILIHIDQTPDTCTIYFE